MQQLGTVLRALGHNPTDPEVEQIKIGRASDKPFTFEEFIEIITPLIGRREENERQEMLDMLKSLDKEGKGSFLLFLYVLKQTNYAF